LKSTLKIRKVFKIKRTDTFTVEGSKALREVADGCARLWNEVNYEQRQA